MIKRIYQLYQNSPRLQQVISLSAVNVILIPVSIVSSIIMTRFLGPSVFGDFKLLTNIFSLVVVIFNFGLFQAGNRALVTTNDFQKVREYYGAELVIFGVLFLVMAFFLLGYAFLDRNINEKGLRNILIFLIPFSWVFLLVVYFEVLLQADNKIKLLANTRLYPKLGFFISVLIIYFVHFKYDGNRLNIIWFFFMATHILVFLHIIYKINPSLKNLKTRINYILFLNRTFGFNVYLGSLFSVGLSQLAGVLISYFGLDNTGVGYFSMATTIAGPLVFIPNVIATTHYKDFSSRTSIPRKLLLLTMLLSCSTLVMTLLLVKPFIKYFYKPEFYPVVSLTYIVSIGIIFSGIADLFNRFLGSHGQGKALRNSSIIVGISLLVCNITLIPRMGEKGAAYTSLFSGIIYFLTILWFYRRLVSKLTKNKH
jgi:O-antigen/teichoic acid export membrane protein